MKTWHCIVVWFCMITITQGQVFSSLDSTATFYTVVDSFFANNINDGAEGGGFRYMQRQNLIWGGD